MRWALLGATALLAGLAGLASPLGELLGRLGDPGEVRLHLGLERRCSEMVPEDPWQNSRAELLERWVRSARESSGAPGGQADSLYAESLRLTAGAARALLEAFFSLQKAHPETPPREAVDLEDIRVRFCPGPRPLWEIGWRERTGNAEPERWLALLAIEELDISVKTHLAYPEGFAITDFDWGRDPTQPGAEAPELSMGEPRR